MKITASEKALLLKALNQVYLDRQNYIGEKVDKDNLIKRIENTTPIPQKN